MSETSFLTSFEMLTDSMNDIAREIGEMDPDDPLRADRIKELFALTELSRSPKSERNRIIHQRMDELAREIATLKPADPRRTYIVSEILRLSGLISK